MRYLVTLLLFVSFLIIFQYCDAQEIKVKDKGTKTKVKEVTAGTVTKTNTSSDDKLSNSSNPQVLKNTSWKKYISDPLNDTAIWRFTNDSSFVESVTGENFVTGMYTTSHDTLSFYDMGGKYGCPSEKTGKYRFSINGDWLKLDLIEDDCLGRAMIIHSALLQKVKNKL